MGRFLPLCIGACALIGVLLTTGCGPGLVALGGGGTGTFFGLQGGDDDNKGGGGPKPNPNVAPAVIVSSLMRGDSPADINFTVIDPNADFCSIEMQYSLNGVDFLDCFVPDGGEPVTGLASSASGTQHTFTWDFVSDLNGPQFQDGITIRARANDGQITGTWNELTGQRIGNNPPGVANISFSNNSGIVLFTFDLMDENSDACSFDITYSVDQGQNWIPVQPNELLGNPPVNLATSPLGTPNQFIWDSKVGLLDYAGDILMSFTPKDHPTGYAEITVGNAVVDGPHSLDNSINNPPALQLLSNLDGQQFIAQVPLQVTLADDESDASAVFVEYSLDGGNGWGPATLVNQFTPGIAGPFPTGQNPTVYNLIWNALADVGQISPYQNNWYGVLLRLTPEDAQAGAGDAEVSEGFTLIGNTPPLVTGFSTVNPGGNITLAVRIQDVRADPASALFEYSTDGSTFIPLTAGDFLPVGDLPGDLESSNTGKTNQLIWDTSLRFPNMNAATVYMRITPTDHPVAATPAADLAGVAFTSAPFSVVNNPAGADPVSINVITTNVGGTPTANPQVTVAPNGTVYFDRVVSPASSTVQETFWKISESGPQWGALEVVGGGPLQHATGGFTLDATVAVDDTIRIHDGISAPVTFQFWDGGAIQVGNQPVDVTGLSTVAEFADALVLAINAVAGMRLTAAHSGAGVVVLQHEVACRVGNAASVDTARGNAQDIVATPATILNGPVNQLGGGNGTQRVQFIAPATPPAGSTFVEILCQIDHDSFYDSVHKTYRLYWGRPVSGVTVAPPTSTILVGNQVQLTATINPTPVSNPPGAPQIATWEVVGGIANGTITDTGPNTAVYTAPATTPGGNLLNVTVRASSIDPTAPVGTASITVQPEPSTISVTSGGSGSLLLSGTTPSTRQFNAVVSPAAAPSGVNWTVWHNGSGYGSGSPTVGTITSTGLYTAPQSLPDPVHVEVRAASQVKPTVVGSASFTLEAPAPTSFQLSPGGPVNLFAGGAGQQFTVTNFSPSNANTNVTWELSAQTGSVTASGYYTPPATANTSLTVTVRARSAANTTVFASAVVNIAQNQFDPPTALNVTPLQAYTYSGGPQLQFSHVVSPASASQQVVWGVVSGGGTISSTGLFTPPVTAMDTIVTIQCQVFANGNINRQVTVCVTGDGRNWADINPLSLASGQPNMVWDSHNDRSWLIGGRTPSSGAANHDRSTLMIDTASGKVLGQGPTIGGLTYTGAEPTTIAAVYDSENRRLIALLGKASGPLEMWQLDVTQTNPSWAPLAYGGGTGTSTLPTLNKSHTYHVWYEPGKRQLHVLWSRNWLYVFNCNTNAWASRVQLNGTNASPAFVEYCGHGWDGSSASHYFVGPTDLSASASTRFFALSTSSNSWVEHSPQNGPLPSFGLANPSTVWVSDRLHVFGGIRTDTGEYVDSVYTAKATWNPGVLGLILAHWEADWTTAPKGTGEERPSPRGDAGFARVGSSYVLYGGEVGKGSFGDFWEYRPGQTPAFIPYVAAEMRPQGRRDAAGAMVNGVGYIYGGMASHGPCGDLWRMNYNSTAKTATWTRLTPATVGQAALPPAVHGASMVHDEQNNRILMFGGDESGSTTAAYSDKLYAYNYNTGGTNPNTWSALSPGGTKPTARRGAAMCYDPENRRVWLFGGQDATGRLNDLHYLDVSSGLPGSWTKVSGMTGSLPDPRMFATIGWDTINHRLMVIGGDSSVSGPNSQLYEYRPVSKAWVAHTIGNAGFHENVAYSGAIWDAACGRFIHCPAGRTKAQAVVMATPGPQWQYLTTPPSLTNGTGSTGLYDPVEQRYYVLFGDRTTGNIGTNGVRTVDFK